MRLALDVQVVDPPPLPEVHADTAVRALAKYIAELRIAGLEYQFDKARGLRRCVVAAAEALTERDEPET
ncbi:MAG: hypothetical protein WCJ30_10785 [Deltaproteobacteria bacterium]